MRQIGLTRRGYSTIVGSGIAAALAGCTGGEDGDDPDPDDGEDDRDDDGNDNGAGEADGPSDDEIASEYGPIGVLTVHLENEDGAPVSAGVEIMVTHDDEDIGSGVTEGIENGEVDVELYEEGPYTISVESMADEFDTVEDGHTIEDDEEVTMVLDGAPGDDEDE